MATRGLTSCSSKFFAQKSDELFLSPAAAVDVCRAAAAQGLVVTRIEGGIFRNGKFMPRVGCIWDGDDPPVSERRADSDNLDAAEFVLSESSEHNAFIITAPPISA